MPALPDLLPVTTVHVFGDERPALGAKLLHQVNDLQRERSGEKGPLDAGLGPSCSGVLYYSPQKAEDKVGTIN